MSEDTQDGDDPEPPKPERPPKSPPPDPPDLDILQKQHKPDDVKKRDDDGKSD